LYKRNWRRELLQIVSSYLIARVRATLRDKQRKMSEQVANDQKYLHVTRL